MGVILEGFAKMNPQRTVNSTGSGVQRRLVVAGVVAEELPADSRSAVDRPLCGVKKLPERSQNKKTVRWLPDRTSCRSWSGPP